MRFVEEFEYYDVEDELHPEIRSRYRRQLWLEILIPTIGGAVIVAGLALVLARSGVGTVSAWADAALALMLIPFLLLALIPLVAIAGLAYGVGWVTGQIPAPLNRVRAAVYRARISLERGANLAVQPIIQGRSAKTAVGEALSSLVDILRPEDKEPRG